MSIRNTKFERDVLALWKEIEDLTSEISSAGLSTEEVDEIAHLKKVVKYISDMLKGIDPDFVPLKVLDTVKNPITSIKNSLVNYQNTENFTYIRNINNDYLDTILRDLMPFIFYKGSAATALRNALNQYTKSITEHYQSYLRDIKSYAEETEKIAERTKTILSDLSEKQEMFTAYNEQLFDEDNGIKNRVYELVNDFENKNEEILELHDVIFNEDDGIEEQIKAHLQSGKEQNKELLSLKENSSQILDELEEFYDNIFGVENNDGEREGGLKNELNIMQKELDDFKIKQQERYKELNSQIENLLPGATSAGLSHAYNDMHEKFSKEVKNYGHWFYGSLAVLFIVVLFVTFTLPDKSASLATTQSIAQVVKPIESKVQNIEIESGNNSTIKNEISLSHRLVIMLDNLIYRLPFVLPAIWLVLFVSRRRNEAQRLAQEYAHKEALAKSYESYKQQIEKLEEEDQNKLLPILMKNMLKAISLNPAETLDKNHKEVTPLEEILKKKEFWEHIEKVKESVIPKKSS